MTSLDIIILVVAAGALVTGFSRGVIRQLGSVVGLVAAIIACRVFGEAIGSMFTPEAMGDTALGVYVGKIVGGTIVYVLVYVVVGILARGLRFAAHVLMLGPVDRVLGAVMALVKWGVALSVALNLWLALFPSSQVVRQSTLCGGKAVGMVMEFAPALWGVATDTVFDDESNQSSGCNVVEENRQQ